jgi:hypothetical protein
MADTQIQARALQRGASPVNDELEVGYDARFERTWHRAEIAGRVVMVLIVAAGLAGLFGRGPFSHHTEATAARTLSADFEPVARWGTPTDVTLHIRPPPGDQHEVRIRLSSQFVEPMGLSGTLPRAEVERAAGGDLLLTLSLPPAPTEALLRIKLNPIAIGPVSLFAQVDGGERLTWTQVVLP